MGSSVEIEYRDLLHPIKDPEKSFAINISDLLNSYIENYIQKSVPNFNSAALLLQGSSCIYGKKVEYLHHLATQLYHSLIKNKKEDQTKKDPKEKEKAPKENKLNDPFFSTEIKPGRNLSCLRKKNTAKNAVSKKSGKKSLGKKYAFVPVDLLPLEHEEKGEPFYDILGDLVSNKRDYALNRCQVTTSGWLLLPTVSPDLIPDQSSAADYCSEIEVLEENFNSVDSDTDMPESTPSDEGYPASSGCPSSPPSAPSSQIPSSQTSDEGMSSLTSTPCEGPSQPDNCNSEEPMESVESPGDPASEGIENIPMDGLPGDSDLPTRPVRRSMRQALKVCQLDQEGDAGQTGKNQENVPDKEEMVALKRAISKKNTCNLPTKLRKLNDENGSIQPASVFCARTFFSVENKYIKLGGMASLEVTAFANNTKFINQIKKYTDAIKAANRKKMLKLKDEEVPSLDDDEEVDVDGLEVLKETDPDGEIMGPLIDDDDIVIDHEPFAGFPDSDESPIDDPATVESPARASVEIDPNVEFHNAVEEQMALYKDEVNNFIQKSDISEKVHEWQEQMKPFLEKLSKREAFDINLYGSRILASFDDSKRKQTMTFRNFCKGMEKWQIHRYFMALLPLVNVGNVSIESEARSDGLDDILITLLSRKMRHLEIEEFGHGAGEHS